MKEGEEIVGCIQAGEECKGEGNGCEKCMKKDGDTGCCEGTEPWGCGWDQTPICREIPEGSETLDRG